MAASAGVTATPVAAGGAARFSRDSLVGSAALVFAASVLLSMIGNILLLVDVLQNHALALWSVGRGFALLSSVVTIAAFAVVSFAFLASREKRQRRLARGALVLAVAFTATSTADIVFAVVGGSQGFFAKTEVASYAAYALGYLTLALAALIATVAFFKNASGAGGALSKREGLLGWAGVCLAAAFALLMTSDILDVIYLSGAGATAEYTARSGGDAVAIAAALVGVAALFVSRRRQEQAQPGWLAQRESILGVTLAVFAVAFLVTGIGGAVGSAADHANGFDRKEVTADWLSAIHSFGFMIGAACASIGFLRSRRSRAITATGEGAASAVTASGMARPS
jgi:hypothetical protein